MVTSGKNGNGPDLSALIAQLPTTVADQLYEEIAQSDADGARRQAVRNALVDKLNAERRQHARRLFTDLFRAMLSHDPLLLRPDFCTVGVIHPIDIGGIWAKLSEKAMASLARKAETLLRDLAQTMPLRVAFRDPAVLSLQAAMRTQALDSLAAALAGGAVGKTFLDDVNRWRLAEGRRIRLGFEPRPWVMDDLKLVHGVLVTLAPLTSLLDGLREAGGNAERLRVGLERAAVDLAQLGAPAEQLGPLLPETLLHADRLYLAGRLALLHGPRRWQEPVVVALVRHLGRTAFSLVEEVLAAIGVDEIVRPGLVFPVPRRAQLDRELDHLDTLLGIFEDLDLINHPRYGAMARDYLDRMVRRMETEFYPVLVERCAAEARSIIRPIPDYDALDWALGFCNRWRSVLKRSLFWGTGHSEFRDRVLDDLRDGFRGSFTRTGYDGPVQRIAHALHLSQLGNRLDSVCTDWVGLLDQGVVRTVVERLKHPQVLSAAEAALLRGFAVLAEEELKRTRHWRDPALQELVDRAAERLATVED